MNWTEEDLRRRSQELGITPTFPGPTKLPPARGRMPKKGQQNKTEAAYDAYLALQLRMGAILWYQFEAITIKLGPDCRFCPDFLIMLPGGSLQAHDTKGAKKIKVGRKAGQTKAYAEEDALVKARVTAGNFVIPIFFVWQENNGEWSRREF